MARAASAASVRFFRLVPIISSMFPVPIPGANLKRDPLGLSPVWKHSESAGHAFFLHSTRMYVRHGGTHALLARWKTLISETRLVSLATQTLRYERINLMCRKREILLLKRNEMFLGADPNALLLFILFALHGDISSYRFDAREAPRKFPGIESRQIRLKIAHKIPCTLDSA